MCIKVSNELAASIFSVAKDTYDASVLPARHLLVTSVQTVTLLLVYVGNPVLTEVTYCIIYGASIYSKTCLKRNAIVPVFFSVFTGFRFTKGCVLIKQSTKNMIAYDYNEGII